MKNKIKIALCLTPFTVFLTIASLYSIFNSGIGTFLLTVGFVGGAIGIGALAGHGLWLIDKNRKN